MDKIKFSTLFLTLYLGIVKGVELPNVEMVIRHNTGDLFLTDGNCETTTCSNISRGTSTMAAYDESMNFQQACVCHCNQNLPVFREDFNTCVEDIQECPLAPFVNGVISEKVPYVFLPLKGQIVHPSRNVILTSIEMPVCAISQASFLTERGWFDLKNPTDGDIPFRLFRDEGKTYIQWVGDSNLRNKLSGKLILVHLLCRELTTADSSQSFANKKMFTPCVAFRVAGSSPKQPYNISEVTFSADPDRESTSSLYTSEYIVIGVCVFSVLIIYIVFIAIYTHYKKQKTSNSTDKSSNCLRSVEEGIIKNNPLLNVDKKFVEDEHIYSSEATSSDTEIVPRKLDGCQKINAHVTSALVHSHHDSSTTNLFFTFQDSSSLEKRPEANVSIVETLEGRDELSDTFQDITGITKKKLYFNPSYFEPHLLLAPPPAAIEFLTKIREVICVAKQKLTNKRFMPSLIRIPEEDSGKSPLYENTESIETVLPRHNSMVSLKRENSRRRTCTGCPGCEPQDLKALAGKLPQLKALVACQNCTYSSTENKQKSIQKWLENVPLLKSTTADKSSNDNFLYSEIDAAKKDKEETSTLPLMELYRHDFVYEVDSLERKSNYNTLNRSQASPTHTALPMSEEMTMGNAVINTLCNTLEIPTNDEYSMVSEVYVNNGYNYNSASSSPIGSTNTTLEKPRAKTPEPKVALTIEVEDCPDNYRQVESPDFEPDTFDRKLSKKGLCTHVGDSDHILLKTTGSFNSQNSLNQSSGNFTSLREIFEFKTKFAGKNKDISEPRSIPPDIIPLPYYTNGNARTFNSVIQVDDDLKTEKDGLLSLKSDEQTLLMKPTNNPIVFQASCVVPMAILEPIIHLQASNGIGATKLSKSNQQDNCLQQKVEDSGYLSSDSSEYKAPSQDINKSHSEGSETDESFGDGHSESGAESVETHSVFFNKYTKPMYLSETTSSEDFSFFDKNEYDCVHLSLVDLTAEEDAKNEEAGECLST